MEHIDRAITFAKTDNGRTSVSGAIATAAAVIIAILIYCMWKRHGLTLAIILASMLVFLGLLSQDRYPPYIFLIFAIVPTLGELAFVKMGIHKYHTTEYIPLWMVPMWGLIGYYTLLVANIVTSKKLKM